MIKQYEVEEIKKLIKSGFDLELISFELNIPIEEIKELYNRQEKQKIINSEKNDNLKKLVNGKDMQNHHHSELEQMRERYRKLFFKSDKIQNISQERLSLEEIEIINSTTEKIERVIIKMKSESKGERRKDANIIQDELKEILKYPLTVEQLEKNIYLLQSEELKNIKSYSGDKIEKSLNNIRKEMIKKLAKSIDIAQSQTEELDKLKELEKKLTAKLENENQVYISAVRIKISNKILKIKQRNVIDKIRNDISKDILGIIEDLINGTIDVVKANTIIETEAKKN